MWEVNRVSNSKQITLPITDHKLLSGKTSVPTLIFATDHDIEVAILSRLSRIGQLIFPSSDWPSNAHTHGHGRPYVRQTGWSSNVGYDLLRRR